MDTEYIVVFKNTFDAMNAEKILKKYNFKIKVIPTPTYITKSCGISLLVNKSDINSLKELISNESIYVKNVFLKNKGKAIQSII